MPTHRPALHHLSDYLARQPHGADAWMDGDDLHALIRLCLLKADRRREQGHGCEADRLHGRLDDAYRRTGCPVVIQRGQLFYHLDGLRDALQPPRPDGRAGDGMR